MQQDIATLQIISDTLKEEPNASQRTLAKKANISLGLMNAILGRFVERGWIMLTNVNGRKFAYAVTSEGIAELAERGRRFAKRTFAIANEYNNALYFFAIENPRFLQQNSNKFAAEIPWNLQLQI